VDNCLHPPCIKAEHNAQSVRKTDFCYAIVMPTDKQTIDWYERNAKKYAVSLKIAANSPYHAYYEKPAIYSLLPNLNAKNTLSLGCGSGEDVSYLKKQGATRSVGIDISAELLKIARSNHRDCDFIQVDMENLPFKNAEFDLVFSSFALHYLPTYKKVFKESYRVLKPGGILLFSVGHPLGASMETVIKDGKLQDKRLGVIRNLRDKTRKVYGDYLNHKSLRTGLPQFDVTFWKQPLSTTINELAGAGFVIQKCVEPKPLKAFEHVIRTSMNSFCVYRT
jgi:ubiquinone/menaquinone biosynthesis C-methylase UbiE